MPSTTTRGDPLEILSSELRDDLAAVDALIRKRADSGDVRRIQEIADHLFEAGGKRIRPLLTLATARLLGYRGTHHMSLAAAVEFIHTATLLHDDVVDESNRRRGRPTANLLWDNKSSVLVGDFFFARSFQLMVQAESARALAILADSSATIAEAEVMQLANLHNLQVDEPLYMRIIRGKTAALFSASAEVGAVVAGAGPAQISAFARFGDALGISFQIMDDVLDYSGSVSRMGKQLGDDFRDRKVTLPVIRALAAADCKEREFWVRTIERGDQREGDLEYAIECFQERRILEQSLESAIHWSETAKDALLQIKPHPLREQLARLADFTVSRGY